MQGLLNVCMPQEMVLYACQIPIFDLGKEVNLGVAAIFESQTNSERVASAIGKEGAGRAMAEDGKPDHYICDVGHVDTNHTKGLSDMQQGMSVFRDAWSEMSRGEAKGLIA